MVLGIPILTQILADAQAILNAEGKSASNEAKILAALAQAMSIEAEIQTDVGTILGLLGPPPDMEPASVRFVVPTYRDLKTGAVIKMATSLLNDVTSNIMLEFDNLAGKSVDPPMAGTITLTVTNTSDGSPSAVATAAMGADGKSVDVTPTPGDGTNLAAFTVNFDDMANVDLKANLDCVFTDDPNAANVHFRTDQITTRPIGS